MSYLTIGLSAYTYKTISNALRPVAMDIVLRSLTKSNVLVFIDTSGKIISLSENFSNLIHTPTASQYVKMPLSEAVKIDQTGVEDLITETIKNGSLSTRPMIIRDVQGNPKDTWLTSLAVYDDRKNLVCIAIVLRTNLDLQGEEERPLSEEQKMLVNYYLTQAGAYGGEENQVIKAYFLEQIRLLYSLIQQFSGLSVADKLLTHLNQESNRNGWDFTFTDQEIGIAKEYEGQTLAERLAVLLQEAKKFAVDMINSQIVVQEMKILDNSLSVDNLRYIDKYKLRSIAGSVL